jgi:CHAT domain
MVLFPTDYQQKKGEDKYNADCSRKKVAAVWRVGRGFRHLLSRECGRKEPDKRPNSAKAVAERLQSLEAGFLTPSLAPPPRAVAWIPRPRLVLSACKTGLGETAGGEGVFGLQRAFHVIGARSVIASLWRMDDDATAALMVQFYCKLWLEGLSPLQALREAQLQIHRHPDQVKALARLRGPDFAAKDLPKVTPATATKDARAHTSQWAAFVLSGMGN